MSNAVQIWRGALRVALVVMLLSVGIVWHSSTTAVADDTSTTCNGTYDFGEDTPCRQDDRFMGYCMGSEMPPVWADRAWYAAYYIDQATSITATGEACNWGTDVAFHLAGYSGIASLPPEELGRYYCVVKKSASVCDHSYALGNPDSPFIYQPAYGSKPYYSYQQMLWNMENMFCHEVGHSVSLFHDTGVGGCMKSGASPTFNGYAPHHITHINSIYP